MTYRSTSRGFMYTAPPGPDEEADERAMDDERADSAAEADRTDTEIDHTAAPTEANWTGSVSADD